VVVVVVVLVGAAACTTAGPDAGVPGVGGGVAEEGGARLLRMGALALERGEASAAAGLLEQAVRLRPGDVRAAVLYGRALLALGRARDAAEVFRSVLDRRPGEVAAALGFARAMLGLGRPEVAVGQLRPLLATGGGVEVANLLGVALVQAGRPEEAVAVLGDARREAPADLRLVHNLALALAFAGRFGEAEGLLRPLAEGPGSTRQGRQNLALVLGLAGDLEAAARLMRVDLDDAAVAGNLAVLRLVAGGDRRPARRAALLPPVRPRTSDMVGSAAGERPAGGPAAGVPVRDAGPRPAGGGALPAVAFDAGDPGRGVAPVGEWVLRLGLYGDEARAAAAWRQLQRRFPAALGGLARLKAAEPGPQPLLVGPLAAGEEAERLCAALRAGGAGCDPLRL
jgi:Flp pilus assembly protein TadD